MVTDRPEASLDMSEKPYTSQVGLGNNLKARPREPRRLDAACCHAGSESPIQWLHVRVELVYHLKDAAAEGQNISERLWTAKQRMGLRLCVLLKVHVHVLGQEPRRARTAKGQSGLALLASCIEHAMSASNTLAPQDDAYYGSGQRMIYL